MVLFWWAFCHSQFQHLSWICLGSWEVVDMHGKPERVNVIVWKVASTLGLGVVGTVCWIWQRYTYYSEKAVFRFTWHFIKGFLVWYQQFWTSHCLRPSMEGRRGVRWWSVVVFFSTCGFFGMCLGFGFLCVCFMFGFGFPCLFVFFNFILFWGELGFVLFLFFCWHLFWGVLPKQWRMWSLKKYREHRESAIKSLGTEDW